MLLSLLFRVAVLLWLMSSVSAQTANVAIGWQTDPQATGAIGSAGQLANDLHCNPIQSFTTSQMPATGAPLQSFGTYYIPNSVSGVTTPYCRVALYQVSSSNVYTLVAGTQSGNDIPLTYGNSAAQTAATSGGASTLLYPQGGSSFTVMPNVNYSLCFTNTAGNFSGGASMYLWPQATALLSYAYIPYYPSAPLPNPFPVSLASSSVDTWQVWMNVQVPVSYVPPPVSSSSSSSTGAVYVPPTDYLSVCYGRGGEQNFVTWTYSYTMGCLPGFDNGWASNLGVSCQASNNNGTLGGFFVVNITLNMLVSTTAVYGSGVNTAYQVCSLLPGSQRTVGTWFGSSQSGLQWQTTPITLLPTYNPGACTDIDLCWNNWFYPMSGNNNPNGPANTTAYGLPYWFDGYGLLYQLGSSWGGVTYLNLFTSSSDGGNWVLTQGGTQLMEETGNGPFGDIIENSWKVATTSVPFTMGCGHLPSSTPQQTWTFNYQYTTNIYSVTLNLTINTLAQPVFDNGINSPFLICSLSGTRTAVYNGVTSVSAVSLAPVNADTSQFLYNNYYYAFSSPNGANGVNDGSLGLYYFFDLDGVVMQLATPWSYANTTWQYVNLCTGNAAVYGGSQLQEELATGQIGTIAANNTGGWSIAVSPSQVFNQAPAPLGSQVVHLFTFNMVYVGWCTPAASLPGCYNGASKAQSFDQGYYTLNLTLIMITSPTPSINGVGPNAGYQIGQLLPGSMRTTAVSLTGGFPVMSSTPITLVNTTGLGVTCANGFCWDNYFYPNSAVFAELEGGGTGTDSGNDPNAFGVDFYFDNYGIVYTPPTPWLGTYQYINLCSGNPTTGSPNPNQLVEEDSVAGAMGVASGWTISMTSQRFAQQVSFYFAYSAMGPLTTNSAAGTVTAGWATIMYGTVTAIKTSTPNVYQVITMSGTRSTTNFVGAVTGPISLVGAQMAGNNNNLLYVNSTAYPQGVDGSGWGYTSTSSALLPSAASTSATAAAGSYINLISGLQEVGTGQTSVYSSATMTIVPYPGTQPTVSLPSTNVVATFAGTGGGGIVYVNQTVYVTTYVNGTTPGANNTVYVYSSSSSSNTNLSKGAVAGIVIGCSIGLSLLCVLCLVCLMRGRDDKVGKPISTYNPYNKGETTTSEASRIEGNHEVEMQ